MMMRQIMLMILIFFVISIRGGDWDSLNNLLKDVVFAIPDPGTFTAGTQFSSRVSELHTHSKNKKK